MVHDVTGAPHFRIQDEAVVRLVAAAQHRRQRLRHLVEGEVGHEPEAAVVDADQRHAERREFAGDAEHRAVATQHDGDVRVLADGMHRMAFDVVQSDALGGREVEQHPRPGRLDDARNREQRFADGFGARLPEQGDVAECLRHRPIMQDAPTCLYYHATHRGRGNRHRICA